MATPSSWPGNEMDSQEVAAFLQSHDYGVLSLGADSRGYGFPISYTYDEENSRIIVGFVNKPDSKREEFATASEEATFTVVTYDDVDSWQSVILTGSIRAVDDPGESYQVPDLFFEQDDAADSDEEIVHLDEFERTYYELRVDSVSARQSTN